MSREKKYIRKKISETRSSGLNIGSASIIMVFVVLCMTIFSVLSLMTAVNEMDTAEKYAASTAAYYEADFRAEEVRAVIAETGENAFDQELVSGAVGTEVALRRDGGYIYYSYCIPAEDGEWELAVVLKVDESIVAGSGPGLKSGGSGSEGFDPADFKVIKWEKEKLGTWTPDQDITVWSGEFEEE